MNLEIYLNYVKVRQEQGLNYIDNYETWLSKNHELGKLNAQKQSITWEKSEHNPVNYPDFDSLDNATKQDRMTQGKADYNQEIKEMNSAINELEHLLNYTNSNVVMADLIAETIKGFNKIKAEEFYEQQQTTQATNSDDLILYDGKD